MTHIQETLKINIVVMTLFKNKSYRSMIGIGVFD